MLRQRDEIVCERICLALFVYALFEEYWPGNSSARYVWSFTPHFYVRAVGKRARRVIAGKGQNHTADVRDRDLCR